MDTSIENSKLKEIVKEALVEVIEEKREVFYDLIAEALEDIALVRAIQEGEYSGTVEKEEIFNILDGKA